MTEYVRNDFEEGNLSGWTQALNGGTIVASTTWAHHGAYSAQTAGLQTSGEYAFAYKMFTGIPTAYARDYAVFQTMPTGGIVGLITLFGGSNHIVVAGYDPVNQKWILANYATGGTIYSEAGTSPLTLGVPYGIEIRCTVGSTAGIAELWVDGVLKVSLTGQNLGTNNISGVFVGGYVNGNESTAIVVNHDCVVVADLPIGLEGVPQTFNLTISVSGDGTTNPAAGIHSYASGTNVVVTATPNAGNVFDHWVLEGTPIYDGDTYTVAMTQDHTLQAVFVPVAQNWTLTISSTTGGTTSPSTGGSYPNGTLVNVEAFPAAGYEFNHWTLDGNDIYTNPWIDVPMTQDHNLIAVFSAIEPWNWKDEFTSQNSRWNWSYLRGTGFKRLATVDGLSVAEIGITAASVSTVYSDNDLQGFVVSFGSNKTVIFEARMRFSFPPESPTVGTWGFGFWDSGVAQTLWFLGCSPESDADMRGMRAIMTASGGTFLVNQPINIDQTQWHTYRLEITGSGVIWKVDGVVVAQTSSVPTGSMGSALWNDNGVVINHQQQSYYLNASIDEIIWIDYVALLDTTTAPTNWSLAIAAGTGGTVLPSGTLTGPAGSSTPSITATPNQGYTFTRWLMDGVEYTENPVSFVFNDTDSHTLQAIFTSTTPGTEKTFGNTTIGTVNSSPANYIHGGKFTVAEEGVISSITAYLAPYSGTATAKVAIYSDSAGRPNAKLAESAEQSFSTAGWYTFPVSYAFTAGTYWLVFGCGTLLNRYYVTGVSGDAMYVTNANFTYPTFPATIGTFASVLTAEVPSIYATYTTGALSVSIQPSTNQSIPVNTPLVFTATPAGGTPPYTVRWYVNSLQVATGLQYTYQSASVTTALVQAIVTDSLGATASSPIVTVTVAYPTLSVTVFPTSAAIKANQTQLFTATPSGGSGSYTVSWIDFASGNTIETGLTYTFPQSAVGTYTIFARVVDNVSALSADSANVVITVTAAEYTLRILSTPINVEFELT